jgi:phosphoglycerate dehydrogenase-like enzyme
MSDRIRVRCVYSFTDEDLRLIAAVDPRIDLVAEGEDTQAWASALEDPELEVLFSNQLPEDLGRVPKLRWLHTASAGLDSVIAQDPWSRGITVTNGSGVHAVHMGEYVMGAVLLWSERLEARLAHHAAGRWDRETAATTLPGRRLRGRTAVVVGYGSLGREVGRLLHAFGVRIIAVKADPTTLADRGWREPGTGDPEGALPERFEGPADLRAVVAEADIVVLTLPATPRTTHIVDAGVLGAMRRASLLVNVGRGALIDQAALIEALAADRGLTAVLDVTDPEPLPDDSPLWRLPGVLVTPHISALGEIAMLWHTHALLCAENLRRYVAREPLVNVTSPTAGY